MKSLIALALPLALLMTLDVHAQVPAGAPAGSTGLCKDGSYTSTATKRGACRGHKGVKDWYAADTASGAPATPSPSKAAAGKAPSAPAPAAATPAGAAPAGSTGLCKDGSYTDTATKRGACRGHKGVQEWYGASAAPTAAAPARPAPMPATPPSPARPSPPPMTTPAMPAAPTAAPAPSAAPTGRATPTTANHLPPNPSMLTPAPGGGTGKVWVNSETKVYHCPSDRYYGKTKQGEYMTEADAIAKGNHAARNKTCMQ